MYYLIRDPQHLSHVRDELASIDIHDYKALQRLPHLNAVLYETLRLNPAVPSAGLRLPPCGSMLINGTYIFDGTTIVTPQYSLCEMAAILQDLGNGSPNASPPSPS